MPTETSVVSQSTVPDLCFESTAAQAGISLHTQICSDPPPTTALAHRAFLKKLQFAQGKPNPSKPSPSCKDTLLPLSSDRGQLALPKTFAALSP